MSTNAVAKSGLVAGDINGFFGLVVDNLSILAFLSSALVGIFGFPADVLYTHMFPGTALGVLVGNLAYTRMAARLAARTQREDVTAMPLGLDAPTSIGMGLLVLGPAFVQFKQGGMDEHAAAIATWQLGMAALVVMGVLKFALAFAGNAVTRWVPRAGLLGSIAAIALMLMGFLPLVEILRVPLVGFTGLGLVLYALVAQAPLPGRLPRVLLIFAATAALYYAFGNAGILGSGFHAPGAPTWRFALPWPNLGFLTGLAYTLPYLPLLLPFGLLMVIGGINVTESARAAGDDYSTRDVLLVEAFSTLIAGFCGGVAQTTPYIGQPAYKAMGARRGYVWLTGVFIGLGGVFGYLSNLVELLPLCVLAPILIYVAITITTQAFEATPQRHYAAVALAFFPAIARLIAIKLGDPSIVAPERFAQLFGDAGRGLPELAVIVMLGNGFIITSMIWAGFLVDLIDARPRRAALWLIAGGVLTLFGLIHSAEPSGALYNIFTITPVQKNLVLPFAGAYFLLATIFGLLSLQRRPA